MRNMIAARCSLFDFVVTQIKEKEFNGIYQRKNCVKKNLKMNKIREEKTTTPSLLFSTRHTQNTFFFLRYQKKECNPQNKFNSLPFHLLNTFLAIFQFIVWRFFVNAFQSMKKMCVPNPWNVKIINFWLHAKNAWTNLFTTWIICNICANILLFSCVKSVNGWIKSDLL